MTTFTPEQVEAEFTRLRTGEPSLYTADMLHQFAATLRQAPAQGGEAMVDAWHGRAAELVDSGASVEERAYNNGKAAAMHDCASKLHAALFAQQQETPCSLDEALAVIEAWASHGGQVHGNAATRFRALVDRIAPQQQGQGEEWSRRMAAAEAGLYVGAGSHGIEDHPAPPAQPAERGVEEVAAWVEAKREHKRLVGVYNDRLAYAKQHDLGRVSVDHEYQAMCAQQRVMEALVEPMFTALAASPAPSPARTIYDHRVRVDEACRDAAPRLYSALKNLLDAVKERPDNMGIESVVTGDAENALLAASPARGDGGEL